MTDSDYRSDSLPISPDDAVEILQQADLAAQAGVSLSAGLRAMAAETNSSASLVAPLCLTALTLVAMALAFVTAWTPYLTVMLIFCVLFGSLTVAFSLFSSSRAFRSRDGLIEMANRLDQGEPLPQVLSAMRSQVSPMILTLFKNGAELGRFDTALHWAAEQWRQRRSLHWILWFALSYPLFLLLVAGAIGSFLLLAIVPSFKKIFDDFGTELPVLTKIVVSVSDGLVNYWIIYLSLLLIATAIIGPLLIMKGDWLVTRKWSPYLPVVGALFHLETLSEFCNLLAVFMDSQMTVPTSLRLAAKATRDLWLQSACNALATDIELGHSSDVAALSAGIPLAISQVLRESASSTSIAEALRGLADLYSTRAEVNSRFVAVIAEPFIIIMTAISLGTTVVALYLPLIRLLNDLA